MQFIDADHEWTYQALISRTRMYKDREFQSAVYVLAAIDKNLQKYIEPETIKFTALMEASAPWSSGEKALLQLAATLYNGTAWPVNVAAVFYNLDETNTCVALEALKIRYGRRTSPN